MYYLCCNFQNEAEGFITAHVLELEGVGAGGVSSPGAADQQTFGWVGGAAEVASPLLRREGAEGATGGLDQRPYWVLGEARKEGALSNPASTCHPDSSPHPDVSDDASLSHVKASKRASLTGWELGPHSFSLEPDIFPGEGAADSLQRKNKFMEKCWWLPSRCPLSMG